jgi:hypothetical protein
MRLLAIVLGLPALLLILVQLASPLRISFDSSVILLLADTHARGGGFLLHGNQTVIPPGYPWLLSQLIQWGAATPFTILSINYLALAAAFAAANALLRSRFALWERILILALTLLSFPVVKHLVIVCNEFVFAGFLFPALWMMDRAWRESSFRGLIWAWVLTFGAIAMRRPGVMLLVPLCLLTAWLWWKSRSWKYLLFPPLLVAMAWFVRSFYTLADYTKPATDIAAVLQSRFTELGQIALNLPAGQLPRFPVAALFAAGALLLGSLLYGLWRLRKDLGPADLFFLAYTGMMFTWTFTDVRFWVPIAPLMISYVLRALDRLPRWMPLSYVAVWGLLGLAALGFSSRVTLSGSRFPDVYASGKMRDAYCVAWRTCEGNPKLALPDDVDALRVVYPK